MERGSTVDVTRTDILYPSKSMYGRALSEQKGVAPIHGDWKSQLRERDENHARVEEEREEGIGKTRSIRTRDLGEPTK